MFAISLVVTLFVGALIAWGIWVGSMQYRKQRHEEIVASVDALRRPAVVAYNNGDYFRSVKLFERVYAITQDPVDKHNLINAYIEYAVSQTGDEALRALSAAYKLDSGSPRINIYLGNYYDTAGNKATALRFYDASLQAMTDRPDEVTQQMRNSLAVIYVNLGDYAHQAGPINGKSDQDLWRTAQDIDPMGPAGAAAQQRLTGGM